MTEFPRYVLNEALLHWGLVLALIGVVAGGAGFIMMLMAGKWVTP